MLRDGSRFEMVECVQPTCGRLTPSFYRVDERAAEAHPGVVAGPSCCPCVRKIVADPVLHGRATPDLLTSVIPHARGLA